MQNHNNLPHHDELDEMKKELKNFKMLLANQEITNQKMLQKIIRHNAHSLYHDSLTFNIVGICTTPVVLLFMHFMHHSIALMVATAVLMLGSIIFDLVAHSIFTQKSFIEEDTATLCKLLHRYKKRDYYQLLAIIPILLAWASWFFYEIATMYGVGFTETCFLFVCGLIGGVIGGTIGLHHRRKQLRRVDEILEQIHQD